MKTQSTPKRVTLPELFGAPTQTQVAEHLGVDVSIVNRWARGRAIPNGYNLQRIAKFFGVSADDIDLGVVEGRRVRSAEPTAL